MKQLPPFSILVAALALSIALFLVATINQSLTNSGKLPPASAVTSNIPLFASQPTPAYFPPSSSSSAPAPAATPCAPAQANAYPLPDAPGSVELTIPGAIGDAVVPAALTVKPTDPDLTPWQQDRVTAITQEFTKKITSGSVDPNDPAYLDRWHKAQSEADDNLRVILDQDTYAKYALRAGIMSSN